MERQELKVYDAYIMEVDFHPDDAPVKLDAIVSSNSSIAENDWSGEAACFVCYKKDEADAEIDYWKQENRISRNLANMAYSLQQQEKADLQKTRAELRATKMALWHSRANRAFEKILLFTSLIREYKTYVYIDGLEKKLGDGYSSQFRTPHEWVKIFERVEKKCREKAEIYDDREDG